jgi:hypothetical protein
MALSRKQLDDAALAERLEAILINTADGRRSVADDRQCPELRNTLMSRGIEPPSLVFTHPSLDSFSVAIKRLKTKDERVRHVRDQFEPFIDNLNDRRPDAIDSAMWTGTEGRAARLRMVRGLLPLAQNAVDSMIATLSEPNANGGPLLDSRIEAIDELRRLHQALGELLTAVDNGHLDDELGQNLQAEVARYGKRVAKALRDDPMPYLSSALLLGLFTACGIPGLGGYLSGIALTVQKHTKR